MSVHYLDRFEICVRQMTHGSLIFASNSNPCVKDRSCALLGALRAAGVLIGEFARVLHKVHCEKQFLKTQWSEKL